MYWSLLVIIIASFTWGYLVGKPNGMRDGYRTCMREVLKARCEGRLYLGTSYDDWTEKNQPKEEEIDRERAEGLDLIYGTEYAQTMFPCISRYHERKELKVGDEKGKAEPGVNS